MVRTVNQSSAEESRMEKKTDKLIHYNSISIDGPSSKQSQVPSSKFLSPVNENSVSSVAMKVLARKEKLLKKSEKMTINRKHMFAPHNYKVPM